MIIRPILLSLPPAVVLSIEGVTKEAEDLEGEALKLSPADRAWLAERLLSSLDEVSVHDPKEIETAWIEESNRRFEAYRTGKMTGQPAQEAITEILAEPD